MADKSSAPKAPDVTEESPLTPAEVRALLARVHKLEEDARKRRPTTPADEPEAAVAPTPEMPEIQPVNGRVDSFDGVRKIGKRDTPDLYAEMRELPLPEARHPDEALYAVRLKGQGKGFWPAYPRERRQVDLSDPQARFLIPQRDANSREVIPLDDLKNPKPNRIGTAMATPWYVPSLGYEVFCDARAAAHENTPQVEKLSLWCPLYELRPGSTHAHEEHGAFCGVGEEPDRIQADKWEQDAEEDTGLCMGCKDHPKKRQAVRGLIERIRS